jgi:TPR repeat protein
MAQRPTGSPTNPATVNSAATSPAGKIAQNGAVPATVAKQKPYVKVPRTPEELWMDVAAGNTAAQIMLAQMYAVGDGVGKNCEQARVLLKAAAAKGNAEAIKKYDDINETSCK